MVKMSEFEKSHYRSLDAKGRIMLPVDYRDALSAISATGSFVLTGFHGRLVAYSPEAWQHTREQFSKIKNPSMGMRHFMSKVRGLAEELIPDGHGRIRIPQSLMREGGLVKDIVLVGMDSKFEIWDQGRFEGLVLEDVSEELAANNVDISL